MLVLYALKEAYQTVVMHRARTLSMGFGVGWALFILIVLLGIGNGFRDGVQNEFAKYGQKTMFFWSSRTEEGYHPIPTELTHCLSQKIEGIDQYTPFNVSWDAAIRYEAHTEASTIFAIDACFASLANLSIKEGRFFTAHDEATANNVCVLGIKLKEKLFGDASAIGQYVFANDTGLRVVGILDALTSHMHGEEDRLLVTNSFYRRWLLPHSQYISQVRLTLFPETDDQRVEKQLRSYFARHLNLDPNNERLFRILNINTHAKAFQKLFHNTAIFIWLIGICFLITGAVGTTNMMLVTIQERTQEFAIRRVLGARSREIVCMILGEVTIVTLCAGIIGYVAGFSCLHLLNTWVVPLGKSYCLAALTCPADFIVKGLGAICVTSCLAGILPAYRALKIKPVEALNN